MLNQSSNSVFVFVYQGLLLQACVPQDLDSPHWKRMCSEPFLFSKQNISFLGSCIVSNGFVFCIFLYFKIKCLWRLVLKNKKTQKLSSVCVAMVHVLFFQLLSKIAKSSSVRLCENTHWFTFTSAVYGQELQLEVGGRLKLLSNNCNQGHAHGISPVCDVVHCNECAWKMTCTVFKISLNLIPNK